MSVGFVRLVVLLISSMNARACKNSRDCHWEARARHNRSGSDNLIFHPSFNPFFKRHDWFALSSEGRCNIQNLHYQTRHILARLKVSFFGFLRVTGEFLHTNTVYIVLKFVWDCVFTLVDNFKKSAVFYLIKFPNNYFLEFVCLPFASAASRCHGCQPWTRIWTSTVQWGEDLRGELSGHMWATFKPI